MASEPDSSVPLAQWRDIWYHDRSKAPWQLNVSNLPIRQRVEIDKPAELEIEPRGSCGSIDEPVEAGQPLIIRAYPIPEIGRSEGVVHTVLRHLLRLKGRD